MRQRIFGIDLDKRAGAACERFRPRAHARHEQVTQLVPARKTQLLREPHERCRLHLGPFSHLAHGGNSDFVGMIQQESRSHLELRTQF
jgi:hypothetical protein